MASPNKPQMLATSNGRQGDPDGRKLGDVFHPYHACCSALSASDFLNVSSLPGLSKNNIDTHKIPAGKYKGLTMRQRIDKLNLDGNFNGHLVWFFLCNDQDFFKEYFGNPEGAVNHYLDFLRCLVSRVRLKRFYFVSAPFRQSDFEKFPRMNCSVAMLKMDFNERLRQKFKNLISFGDVPVSLIDLNLVMPEIKMESNEWYCPREIHSKFRGIHYNKHAFAKVMRLVHDCLNKYDGLSKKLEIVCTRPSIQSSLVKVISPNIYVSVSEQVRISSREQAKILSKRKEEGKRYRIRKSKKKV